MYPMTTTGEKLLRDELEQLVKVERPHIIKAIATAREHGDLKENAEYHTAKDRQGFIEARIRDIEAKLTSARVIDIKDVPFADRVVFGSTITLRNLEDDSTVQYQIVGDDEANIDNNKISYASPVAKSAMGKNTKTEIEVQLPTKKIRYIIEKVEHI